MEKKKVLFVATVVKTHIMQFHVPYLKLFRQMGWETAVAARNDYADPADCRIPYCDAYYDLPIARIPWKTDNFRAYRMLKQIIDREDYDLIHCHTPMGAVVARLAALGARKRGTKVLYTAHGFHFFRGAPARNWLLFFPMEWLLSFVTDVLITINREDYARAKKRLHPKRLEYVPGVGVHIRRFQTDRAAGPDKRRELGRTAEDFLLLTVAEMTRNKNHTTILNALALLKDKPEFTNMHYLICGRGETRPALERQAKALGIGDHVHFLGYRQDVPALYGCSDLFVFMPYREGLPVALMEAMSSGLPVICSRIRGNRDLIEDGVCGVFAENRPQAVAEAIVELYWDPRRREELGKAAAEAVKPFDDENVHRQMKEIYLSLL